jgi:hypothetical protein
MPDFEEEEMELEVAVRDLLRKTCTERDVTYVACFYTVITLSRPNPTPSDSHKDLHFALTCTF